MARRAYARGDRAWGRCARTGERVLLKDLVRDGQTGLLVTREAYEPKHPQEKPPRNIFDPQTLRRPAPDNDVTGTFTTATFTWDPGSIADGVTEIKTATVEGALPGATVIVYPGVDLGGMIHSGYVSAPGQVSVLLVNLTGSPVDLGSSTWQVLVTSEIHSPGDTLYVASFAWDPSNVVDGAITTKDVTVTGAAVGGAVLVYPAQPLHGAMIFGYVSAADTVTVVLINFSGGSIEIENPAWPRWRVAVLPESSGASGTFFQQASLYTALSWDPGSVADGATDTVTATVTGAAVGDAVIVYPGVDLQGLLFCGYVSVADTVTVVLYNLTGAAVDLDAAAWAVRVLER